MRRAFIVAGTAAAVLWSVAGTPVARASARSGETWAAYELIAAAAGVRVSSVVPGAPGHNQVAGLSDAWAEAQLDDLGASTARAAVAYPGAPFLSVVEVAKNGATGGAPDNPAREQTEHPFIATSSYPAQESDTRRAGTYVATAESTDDRSMASTMSSSSAEASSVTAEVVRHDSGALETRATSTVEGVVVGDFAAGRISSTSTITQVPGGAPAMDSELVADAATLGGAPLPLRPGTVVATDSTTVRYLEGRSGEWGVTSPVIEVTVTAHASPSGSGPSTVVTTIAESAVAIAADADVVAAEFSRDLTQSAGWEPSTDAADSGEALQRMAGAVSADLGSQLSNGATAGWPTPSGTGTYFPRSDRGAARPLATLTTNDVRWYLPIVVTGLAMACALVVLRRGGVRVWR